MSTVTVTVNVPHPITIGRRILVPGKNEIPAEVFKAEVLEVRGRALAFERWEKSGRVKLAFDGADLGASDDAKAAKKGGKAA